MGDTMRSRTGWSSGPPATSGPARCGGWSSTPSCRWPVSTCTRTDKAGRDAGELCGLGPTGVAATRSIDDILALGADCVLYMPRAFDVDDVCRLLESGANVVTTCGEFHHPASMDPGLRERIEAACRKGGTSIHSTGSSPGFISEAVPLVLTSIQRQLESLAIEEFADLSQRNSPELLFDLMGFGGDPAAFDHSRWSYGVQSFGPSLRLLAEAICLPLDSVEADGEIALARRAVEIVAGRLEAGHGGGPADAGDRPARR